MALQGGLRDFSANEILQLLGSQKKSGCLSLEWNTERIVIFILDGRIVSTRPLGPAADDPLLVFLRRVGRLSDEQHRGVLTIQRESSRDLEDLLINGRYLEADELTGYVERQILDDLTRLVRWENGTYRFDPHARWTNPPLVSLSMEGALIEAARRVDEGKRFLSVFRDPHQLLGVRDLPDPDAALTDEERELFGIIDGLHTVEEVVRAAPLSDYEAYEALHRMLEAEWIEFVGRRDPGMAAAQAPVPTPSLVERGRPFARDLAVAGILVAAVFVLRLLSTAVDPARRPAPEGDIFAAARLRDLRFAVELYHREKGVYPASMDELVRDRWVSPRQTRLPGYAVLYDAGSGGTSYRLDLRPVR